MQPTLVSIFLDYQCNYECAHCSVGSGPQIKFEMNDSTLERMLDGLRTLDSVITVVFTGGEATIHKEKLLGAISRVHSMGFRTRLVSNGWWASTASKARRWVGELRAAGLDELNTSWDDFHVPFAKFESIVNLVREGLAAGMPIGIGVIEDRMGNWNADRVRRELTEALLMSPEEFSQRVAIVSDYATPTGTGETLDVEGLDAGRKLDIGCPEIVRTLSIHPNGSVKACCGHEMFYSQDLTLGNLNRENLTDIVDRAQHNLVYWWIHTYGPKRILERLGVHGQYASICHACHVLLGQHRESMLSYVKAHKAEVFTNDVIQSDFLKAQIRWLGSQQATIENRLEQPGH